MENAQPACDLTVEVVFCKDKPKFGGAGKKKKCCALKRCQMFSSSETTVTTRSSMKRPSSSSQGQACETEHMCTLGTLDPVAQKEISVYNFLRDSGRKVHMVKGDGNSLSIDVILDIQNGGASF